MITPLSTDSRGKTVSHTYDALNRKTGRYAVAVASQTSANRVAAWVYDNANNAVPNMRYPIGQLTTTTAYWGGNPYTTQQRGFNVFGKPLGQTITIPTAEGPLAGAYTFTQVYTATAGLLGRTVFPGRGGLPAETVNHFYTGSFDLPSVVGGLAGYADGTSYDAWGRINQVSIGASPNWAYITNSYDDHTGRLTQQLVTRAVAAPAEVDRQEYQYDRYGNVTRQVSTRLASPNTRETQCFQYDELQRLAQAWTATDDRAATPTPTARGTVGSNLGASSAYWTSWQFDLIGNRNEQTRYATSGGSDTTTTYTHDGNGAGQPHTLTGTATSGATTATTSYGYDDAGNMTSRDAGNGDQSLTWNDAGQLAAITGSTAGNSTFLYDADGNLLLQKDPGTTTLYLPGQQHTLDTTTQAVTGVRYYTLPGGAVCIRTGSGTNYTFAVPDRQGTPTLYLNNTAQNPTWRQYTPYGAPRGTTITPPDNRGFLGKTENTATGLARLGAREYDPTIGRFISVDPVQDMGDPQQWNGYSYANNNPITMSDPDGLKPLITNTTQGDEEHAASTGQEVTQGRNGKWTVKNRNRGCVGTACPKTTTLSCQSGSADIGGSINNSYACPTDDTNVPFKSLGDPPKYCGFWYSDRCNRLANAEVGLESWWMLSCMSGLAGLDNGLACALMEHYMGATGGDYLINADQLLSTPEFSGAVGMTMAEISARAAGMCGGPACTYAFDSGWTAMSFDKNTSESEFYGYRGMTYQVRGSVTVTRDANGNPKTSGTYPVTAYKSWNFDRNEKLRGVPFSGPCTVRKLGHGR